MTNQYRNFDAAPGAWAQAVRFDWELQKLPDGDPDLSWLEADSGRHDDVEDDAERAKYEAEDAARLASYGHAWACVGVRACLRIAVPIGGHSFTTYELTSPGLWGIESDSGEAYFAEVFEEEKAALWDSLRKVGLAVLAFDALALPQGAAPAVAR